MGIPHLITHLQPYAVVSLLDHERLVIDGPAFAYHICHLHIRNGPGQPTYKSLARTAIAWLDELLDHHVTIDAIYFDGALPSAKTPVRLDRLSKISTQLKLFSSANSKSCPGHHLRETCSMLPSLFPTVSPRQDSSRLPYPPFLVPAIIDALIASDKYAHLTHMVPGEADGYCAEHVSKRRGVVLTADSDLLVHEIGDGSVIFLKDMYLGQISECHGLVALKYTPSSIARRLELSEMQGIRRLAFEMVRAWHAGLPQILDSCRKPLSDPEGYSEFSVSYRTIEAADLGALPRILGRPSTQLDPRISELCLQWVGYSALDSRPTKVGDATEYFMFLPPLLDDPCRASAWHASTPTRQLAYSLGQLLGPRSNSWVREYRRVQTSSNQGNRLEMFPEPVIIINTMQFLQLFDQVTDKFREPNFLWPMLALCQATAHSREEEKVSLCIKAIREAPASILPSDTVSWDLVHFSAQLQASLYSFRILRQMIDFVMEREPSLVPAVLVQLRARLSNLPSFSKYPNVESTISLTRQIKAGEMLMSLSTLLGIEPSELLPPREEDNTVKRKKKRKKDIGKKGGGRHKRPSSSNLFDGLAVER